VWQYGGMEDTHTLILLAINWQLLKLKEYAVGQEEMTVNYWTVYRYDVVMLNMWYNLFATESNNKNDACPSWNV
jgi:hypothetical protein